VVVDAAYPPGVGDEDGRLELDDAGGVIESAQLLGAEGEPTDDDVLAGGADEPTWGERIGATGPGAWASRHRGWLAAGAVAVVAGVAIPSYVVSQRPPDADPTVGVSVIAVDNQVSGGPGPGLAEGSRFTASYQLSNLEAGWKDVRVDGVAGPGIVSSTVEEVPAAAGIGRRFAVTAEADCAPIRFGGGAPQTYEVRVSATDAYGRVVTAVQKAPATQGMGWHDVLAQWCFERVPDSLATSDVTIQADRQLGRITFGATVTNPLDGPLLVGTGWTVSPWLSLGFDGSTTRMDPRSSSAVAVTLDVTDCAGPFVGPRVQKVGPDSGATEVVGFSLALSPANRMLSAQAAVELDAAGIAQLQAARDEVCQGMPSARVSVASTGKAERVVQGDSAWAIPVRLQLTTSSAGPSRAAILDPTLSGTDGMETAVRVAADGRTTTLLWQVTCSYLPNPPQLWIRSLQGPPTPQKLDLPQGQLRSAYEATCPGFPDDQFQANGWGPPANADRSA
jgi:hypothetical protein